MRSRRVQSEVNESRFRSEAQCRWSILAARMLTLAFDLTLTLTLGLTLAVLRSRRLPALLARRPDRGRLPRFARTSVLSRD